jgi:hypothetical protein
MEQRENEANPILRRIFSELLEIFAAAFRREAEHQGIPSRIATARRTLDSLRLGLFRKREDQAVLGDRLASWHRTLQRRTDHSGPQDGNRHRADDPLKGRKGGHTE